MFDPSTSNQIVEVPLTKGFVAIVDFEDAEAVLQFKWTALQTKWTVYARRTFRHPDGRQGSIYLHRFLMKPEKGQEVDHKDRNGLNCTRENMRFATSSQNKHNTGIRKNNTSGIKGVSWWKRHGCWRADITLNSKLIHLGRFKSKEEAAAAYRAAAIMLHREFASPTPVKAA
jgi:hypothetical protein